MINKIQCEAVMALFSENRWNTGKASLVAFLLLGSAVAQSNEITDFQFNTAANMLAYTELELSGEPLAESLGLDLDVLDPDEQNQPTEFDYITGIESYEFSEEAMYELNYRSGLGPNLVHGLRNTERGGKESALQVRYAKLASAVAYPKADIVKNLNLISFPYREGTPEFATKVNVQIIGTETIELFTDSGDLEEKTILIPAYTQDYKSLKWVPDSENEITEPAAIGALLLKEVMWSQDFLGGMHTSVEDEEVEASSSVMDHEKNYSLGVSALDGMNGLLLTELSLEKMQYLQQSLGFNGQKLGQIITPDYDPIKSPIWFPHQVKVATDIMTNEGVETKTISQLKVIDASSQLRDQWLLLWPLSEYFAFSDQRAENSGQNPAFSAVFDGQPFRSAPIKNADASSANDVIATDAFSMASNLSNAVFKNLQALHFNSKFGTFVDEYAGVQKSHVTTYDAAYSLVALSIFQRAQDALPVGYASASQNRFKLKTSQGKAALSLIEQQANFIVNQLIQKNGLIADYAVLNDGAIEISKAASVETQFAVIRGLTAAFLATDKEDFRLAARALYLNIEKHYYDPVFSTWVNKNDPSYTPWSIAAISSAMREAMLHLKNNESESSEQLELSHLIERYSLWFRVVVTGKDGSPGLQLAEPLWDTGEHIIDTLNEKTHEKIRSIDSDRDGIKQIQAAGGQYGRASVLANKLILKK